MKLFQNKYRDKLHRLLSIMLPIIGTQIAVIGMNFFDASMSGQAGNVDLAGTAIGGNIWMPVQTGTGGILMAAMPLVANLLGAGQKQHLSTVIRHGLLLAFAAALLVIGGGVLFLPSLLQTMSLEPEVYHVAIWYLASLGMGAVPFFMVIPLRCFIDTLGYTKLTMKIFLLALPINAALNYVLIFGKLGLPRLGGIGAGLATGLTFWLLLFMFVAVVLKLEPFSQYHVLGFIRPQWYWLKDYLRLGVPMGLAIFMETSIFGVVALFIAKFGTDVIAAHQAALNFSSLVYMIPLSFSLASTIVVGVEYGAENYQGAKDYTHIGLQMSLLLAGFYMGAELFARDEIARIYTTNVHVAALVRHFLLYAVIWQVGDAVAAPIQGILRGYKDANAAFVSMLAYWCVCLPLGLFLDYKLGHQAFSYWESLVVGVWCSAVLLFIRMLWLQRKLERDRS